MLGCCHIILCICTQNGRSGINVSYLKQMTLLLNDKEGGVRNLTFSLHDLIKALTMVPSVFIVQSFGKTLYLHDLIKTLTIIPSIFIVQLFDKTLLLHDMVKAPTIMSYISIVQLFDYKKLCNEKLYSASL